MNPPPRPRTEAKLIYGTPEFEIVQHGDHVRCAVSGARIPRPRIRRSHPVGDGPLAGPLCEERPAARGGGAVSQKPLALRQ